MYRNDKRHSHDSVLPNLYFLLQVIIVILLLIVVIQLTAMLQLSLKLVYVACAIAFFSIIYFLLRRKAVLQRQEAQAHETPEHHLH